ncbi:MAG: beta-lactamase family protein [Pseudomonadota bacterium]|nr:beta-lactamase family protein [Pseudomonadota bacterium]
MLAIAPIAASSNEPHVDFPEHDWHSVSPQEAGWSAAKLEEAEQYLSTLPPASVFIVDRGRVVAKWGDPAKRIKVSSIRKSLLSALYGIYAHAGRIALDANLVDVGIDDDPPLMTNERMATLRMLLKSRSGVYHGYVAGTPDQKADQPPRGAHAPDTYWYYNNWDFNALGTAFEKLSGQRIPAAFEEKIAKPIGMQDFRPEDVYYLRAKAGAPLDERSVHPAYHFRVSARDLARFGYLYLQSGKWRAAEVLPRGWVEESIHPYSDAGNGEGYGYLWWINGWGLGVNSFSARGALAKRVIVIPSRELVIVYLNHAEFPDDTTGMSSAEISNLPHPSTEQQSKLFRMILDAQGPQARFRAR